MWELYHVVLIKKIMNKNKILHKYFFQFAKVIRETFLITLSGSGSNIIELKLVGIVNMCLKLIFKVIWRGHFFSFVFWLWNLLAFSLEDEYCKTLGRFIKVSVWSTNFSYHSPSNNIIPHSAVVVGRICFFIITWKSSENETNELLLCIIYRTIKAFNMKTRGKR